MSAKISCTRFQFNDGYTGNNFVLYETTPEQASDNATLSAQRYCHILGKPLRHLDFAQNQPPQTATAIRPQQHIGKFFRDPANLDHSLLLHQTSSDIRLERLDG